MSPFPISAGQGVSADVGIAPPFRQADNPTNATVPKDPEIAAAPPVMEENKRETWTSAPSVANQRTLYPDSVRLADIRAQVFDLADTKQLDDYNALLKRSDPMTGDILMVMNQPQFSEKTDNWKVLIQYRAYVFKQLAPKTTS